VSSITNQELEEYLWGAAVILRGLVDAGDYKQFIFPLVFFKRLSDVWDEDYARALAAYGGATELAQAEANERFRIPDGGQEWSTDSEGDLRQVNDTILYDVSIVTEPAYEGTEIALRSRDEAKKQGEARRQEAKDRADRYFERKAEQENKFRKI